MINEIKIIVQNYLNNVKLCNLMMGTVTGDGVKISDTLIIPLELIKGNLKSYTWVGDKVRLIRNQGGQEFYIVEIIDKKYLLVGGVTSSGVNVNGTIITNDKIVGNLKSRVTTGDQVRLIRDYGNDEFYILEVVT